MENGIRALCARFTKDPGAAWLRWALASPYPRQAIHYLEKSAAVNHTEGLLELGLYFATTPANRPRALDCFLKAARQGHAEAAFHAGEALRWGLSVKPDALAALTWYRHSAELGFGPALAWLVSVYTNGDGAAADASEASTWSAKLAHVPPFDPPRQSALANFHETGGSAAFAQIQQALEEAYATLFQQPWFPGLLKWGGLSLLVFIAVMAVVLSFGLVLLCVAPLIVVGLIHEFRVRHGKVPRSARKLELDASRGDPGACFELGQAFQHGSFSHPRDRQLARRWLLKAAEAGHMEAAVQLSSLLQWGLGGGKDLPESARWLRRAAESGHPGAIKELSRCLEIGDGMEADSAEAEEWKSRLANVLPEPKTEPAALRQSAFQERIADLHENGVGIHVSRIMLGGAFLILAFAGWKTFIRNVPLGHRAKDREVWGDFGQRVKAQGGNLVPVVPQADRQLIGALAYMVQDTRGTKGDLKDVKGRIGLLCVIRGKAPAFRESVPEWREIKGNAEVESVLLYLVEGENPGLVFAVFRDELFVGLATPMDPSQLIPLGDLSDTPVTFVVDRQGRIRQRWVGFEKGLMKRAVEEALAER